MPRKANPRSKLVRTKLYAFHKTRGSCGSITVASPSGSSFTAYDYICWLANLRTAISLFVKSNDPQSLDRSLHTVCGYTYPHLHPFSRLPTRRHLTILRRGKLVMSQDHIHLSDPFQRHLYFISGYFKSPCRFHDSFGTMSRLVTACDYGCLSDPSSGYIGIVKTTRSGCDRFIIKIK